MSVFQLSSVPPGSTVSPHTLPTQPPAAIPAPVPAAITATSPKPGTILTSLSCSQDEEFTILESVIPLPDQRGHSPHQEEEENDEEGFFSHDLFLPGPSRSPPPPPMMTTTTVSLDHTKGSCEEWSEVEINHLRAAVLIAAPPLDGTVSSFHKLLKLDATTAQFWSTSSPRRDAKEVRVCEVRSATRQGGDIFVFCVLMCRIPILL